MYIHKCIHSYIIELKHGKAIHYIIQILRTFFRLKSNIECNLQTSFLWIFLRNFDEPEQRQTQLIISKELSPADTFDVLHSETINNFW